MEPSISPSPDSASALTSLQSAATALYEDCFDKAAYRCSYTVEIVGTELGVAKNLKFLGDNAFLGRNTVICFYDIDGSNYVYRTGTRTNSSPTLGVYVDTLIDGVDLSGHRECPGAATP